MKSLGFPGPGWGEEHWLWDRWVIHVPGSDHSFTLAFGHPRQQRRTRWTAIVVGSCKASDSRPEEPEMIQRFVRSKEHVHSGRWHEQHRKLAKSNNDIVLPVLHFVADFLMRKSTKCALRDWYADADQSGCPISGSCDQTIERDSF